MKENEKILHNKNQREKLISASDLEVGGRAGCRDGLEGRQAFLEYKPGDPSVSPRICQVDRENHSTELSSDPHTDSTAACTHE